MIKKETRYVMIGGLAFSERSDMTRLQRLAEDGWLLDGISFGMWFRLRKADPEQVEYSMDYRDEADEDYFQYFNSAGWQHVLSLDHVHIFKAPRGTKPLYTDSQTTLEKYRQEKKRFGRYCLFTLPLLVLAILSLILIKTPVISAVLSVALALPFIFTFVPYLGYVYQLTKLRRLSL
jgi:hypothetical protein